ncbi:MAG: flagellar motor protein MotA, partial [Alphaproteobacteria bacterium]|nr:flagellar motor protein MotA [Alphaproteobacteria bacterium]
MNKPNRFLVRMGLFLVLAIGVTAVLLGQLNEAFQANPPLNGLIIGVLVLGILYSFRQVLRLGPEVRWIENFRTNQPGASTQSGPTLLSPMARMLADRKGKVMLSAMAMRSLLDGIASRLEESRDISRYMIGLLIFLGLLGTFWGLLDTVSSVGRVISNLAIADENIVATFTELKAGLQDPLNGMGTAFSSSLFGLAGALVLGFLDLQAGQAQNQFYNDLEEWLSSVTRLGSGGGIGDGDQSVPVYVQALLEQTAESLESLQLTMSRGEDDRRSGSSNLIQLTERLAVLTDQMQAEQKL